ncbi:elongator complex protein 6-like isoform X1 [Asterias rubens]|uniref:elongator complex protein 6-like isoform X1 n=2 Tax=Asterias rubens TaxID=7604 RepID=UPI001455A118|nr:elongator complex protein 6-like isoform X1 [Asterias rubens]
MFSELNDYIGFGPGNPPKGQLMLVTDSLTDGSFLIHHFLSVFLKGDHKVCFLALAQSFSHYSAVAQKLGVNLGIARRNEQLTLVNGLDFSLQLMHDGMEESHKDERMILQCLKDDKVSVRPLYNIITESFAQDHQENSGSRLILIDDLSVLISLGLTVQQVMQFIHYCQTSQPDATIVCLVHSDADVEDDINLSLITHLRHQCHCFLQVQGLGSGFSKDIHGQLTIIKRDPDGTRPNRNQPDRTLQYKILDKSVTFFAVGTSSAVL